MDATNDSDSDALNSLDNSEEEAVNSLSDRSLDDHYIHEGGVTAEDSGKKAFAEDFIRYQVLYHPNIPFKHWCTESRYWDGTLVFPKETRRLRQGFRRNYIKRRAKIVEQSFIYTIHCLVKQPHKFLPNPDDNHHHNNISNIASR